MTPENEMTLQSTVEDMLSDDPERMLFAEITQCQVRLKALYSAIGLIGSGQMESPTALQVFLDQARMLDAYISILTVRMMDYTREKEAAEDA